MKTIKEFIKSNYIYLENTLQTHCYLLIKGQVLLINRHFDKIQVKEGQIFGLHILINQQNLYESANAYTNCIISEIDLQDAKKLIAENSAIRSKTITQYIELLKLANQKIIQTKSEMDEDFAHSLFNGFLYYYTENDYAHAILFFNKLNERYKHSPYYENALNFINISKDFFFNEVLEPVLQYRT